MHFHFPPENPDPLKLAAGKEFHSLAELPFVIGDSRVSAAMNRLPLDSNTELLVQLCGTDGNFEVCAL